MEDSSVTESSAEHCPTCRGDKKWFYDLPVLPMVQRAYFCILPGAESLWPRRHVSPGRGCDALSNLQCIGKTECNRFREDHTHGVAVNSVPNPNPSGVGRGGVQKGEGGWGGVGGVSGLGGGGYF